MILFGTGHRPNKLVPFDKSNPKFCYSSEVFNRLVRMAEVNLGILKPGLVISGMALGWDMALAQAATNLGIQWHAYVPCIEQDCRWAYSSRMLYANLLKMADDIHYTSRLTFTQDTGCMQRRNVDMINASTFCLALWDSSPGGTGNCMRVVMQRQMQSRNLWSSWVRYSGFFEPEVVG